MTLRLITILACSLTFALSGCGGGEGGSDNIDFSPSKLAFNGTEDEQIAAKTVDVNVGLSNSARYIGVISKNPDLASVSYEITHIDAFEMRVSPAFPLPKGTHNGAIEVLVCEDKSCNDVDDRGTLNYTITIN